MSESMYNESQWHWVADRISEGYTIEEMSEFLDMHRRTIVSNLVRAGRRIPAIDRVPLDDRKREFYKLAMDGSKIYSPYVSVVGVSPEGDTIQFESLKQAAEFIGASSDQICNAIRYNYRCRGYSWKREDTDA